MPSVKDILIEMKDMSELMVDLAYSAVLFNNKDAAEEVLTLENRLNSMNYEIKKQADLTLKGFEPHPVFRAVMEESERNIIRLKVKEDSDLANESLGDLLLLNRTGMRIISIRRGESWIYGPDKNTVILADDFLIAKGTETGTEILEKLVSGEIRLDDLANVEEFIDEDDD